MTRNSTLKINSEVEGHHSPNYPLKSNEINKINEINKSNELNEYF